MNNIIAIKDAVFQLQGKYQNLYVDVNLEKKLDIIKFFYRYLNHNGYSEVFPFREIKDIFYDKDHLTLSAYEYIESRMSQFSILFNEHKKEWITKWCNCRWNLYNFYILYIIIC